MKFGTTAIYNYLGHDDVVMTIVSSGNLSGSQWIRISDLQRTYTTRSHPMMMLAFKLLPSATVYVMVNFLPLELETL